MHPQNFLENLQLALSNEKQAFSELLQLLSKERTALEQESVEDIKVFSDMKQSLTKKIEKFALIRNNNLSSANMALTESSSIAEILMKLPGYIQQQWQQVLDLAEECHLYNQVNGKIIQVSKSRIDRCLRLLKSQTGDPSLTYNSAGVASLSRNTLNAVEV